MASLKARIAKLEGPSRGRLLVVNCGEGETYEDALLAAGREPQDVDMVVYINRFSEGSSEPGQR